MTQKMAKILIANRAEIAVRVINTCRLMGIASVAVYAEDDRNSHHRNLAGESYSLGEGSLAETYLNQQKIVEIAQRAGAQAIHPGYGFLSERAEFAQLCERSGLIFIGPSPQVIELMGDKRACKQALEGMGIPLIAGHHGAKGEGSRELLAQAKRLGAPLLIKAAAGGGGKGMRLVEDLKDFEQLLALAQGEAQNAFGDSQVILEKFIPRAHHIEVQVLSDSHGQHFHFWERECSIQRRHQKIIEETPSPTLGGDQKLREQICQSAVELCRKIDYLGAGTVEFIFDAHSGEFYFLEMNTRLQVEHPITEMTTGFDLVEGQIRVARGEKLSLTQKQIAPRGHALEVRIYAEDPERDFLPTTGTLAVLGHTHLSGTRLECGLPKGTPVGIGYDPMIAKLCCHASDRVGAIAKMLRLLEDYSFLGLTTNCNYLERILGHPEFVAARTPTHFTQHHREELRQTPLSPRQLATLAVAFVEAQTFGESSSPSLFARLGSFRNAQ